MSAEYKLIILGPNGVKRAEVADFLQLSYSKRVNEPGLLRFELPGSHRAISALEEFGQVEVWRRYPRYNIGWYRDFAAFFRDDDQRQERTATFTAECPGQLSMLGWRHILYKADTLDRTRFVNTKTARIMWDLVRYNAASLATVANGREINAAIPGLSAGSDPDSGPLRDWNCAWSNLLSELQKLQPLSGGDFDIVKTGPQAWTWQFFPGQRGSDKTSTVIFAIERGNITNVRYTRTRSQSRTVAVVGGPGETTERRIRVRLSASHSASNHIETFVDARNAGEVATNATLDARGDAALDAARPRPILSYDVLQVPSCLYGQHYGVGDLVQYRVFDASGVQQVRGVSISYQPGRTIEEIGVELRDVD